MLIQRLTFLLLTVSGIITLIFSIMLNNSCYDSINTNTDLKCISTDLSQIMTLWNNVIKTTVWSNCSYSWTECWWTSSKPLLHPIIRARTSWLQRKSADLQGTLELHLQFYDKISRSHRPCNENWHAHFLCMHAVWLQMHPYLRRNIRENFALAFS